MPLKIKEYFKTERQQDRRLQYGRNTEKRRCRHFNKNVFEQEQMQIQLPSLYLLHDTGMRIWYHNKGYISICMLCKHVTPSSMLTRYMLAHTNARFRFSVRRSDYRMLFAIQKLNTVLNEVSEREQLLLKQSHRKAHNDLLSEVRAAGSCLDCAVRKHYPQRTLLSKHKSSEEKDDSNSPPNPNCPVALSTATVHKRFQTVGGINQFISSFHFISKD